jgi:D-proline reductase (dithiol) PrdB
VANASELPFKYRAFLAAYPWRRVDPVPFVPLRRGLAETRLALVSSAGLVPPGAAPFDDTVRGGDPSFREIPGDLDLTRLTEHHRSDAFDHSAIAADVNLAFPLDRLRERVRQGRLGGLAATHYSFMGSLTAVGRFVRDTAPEIARRLRAEAVDAALVVPVCPMCNQASCLLAAEIERQGTPTVTIALWREIAVRVRPPRALAVPFRFGHPFDRPNDPLRQGAVLDAALALFEHPGDTGPLLVDYVPAP